MTEQNNNQQAPQRQPQDDLPYERRMYYIIRDYRRMLQYVDKCKELNRKQSDEITGLREKLSLARYRNKYTYECLVQKRRECKRLKIHISALEDKIEGLTGRRPAPIPYQDDET